MAKFCGKCGSPLDENGVCRKCGASVFTEADKTGKNPFHDSASAPKKKGFQKKIIIAAAAVVVIGALVFCAFFFHWFGLGAQSKKDIVTSQGKACFDTSYGKYYRDINIEGIGTEDKVPDGTLVDDELKKVTLLPSFAQDGDTFYGKHEISEQLCKFTVTGKDTACKVEQWVSEEQLKNSVLKVDGNVGYEYAYGNFIADGDYIYNRVNSYKSKEKERYGLNYRIFRISKSGDTIEFVGDENVRASDLVVSDGWVYYVDNGYTVMDDKVKLDETRIGIYKIKADGSEKTKLVTATAKQYYISKSEPYSCACALTVYNGKLYYLFNSGDDYLPYCVDLDGSNQELLCSRDAYAFAIDGENNMMYFLASDKTGRVLVNKLDLENRKVFEYNIKLPKNDTEIKISYYSGYLYIVTKDFRRMDVSSGETQRFETNTDKAALYDDDGFQKDVVDYSSTCRWKVIT